MTGTGVQVPSGWNRPWVWPQEYRMQSLKWERGDCDCVGLRGGGRHLRRHQPHLLVRLGRLPMPPARGAGFQSFIKSIREIIEHCADTLWRRTVFVGGIDFPVGKTFQVFWLRTRSCLVAVKPPRWLRPGSRTADCPSQNSEMPDP